MSAAVCQENIRKCDVKCRWRVRVVRGGPCLPGPTVTGSEGRLRLGRLPFARFAPGLRAYLMRGAQDEVGPSRQTSWRTRGAKSWRSTFARPEGPLPFCCRRFPDN
ncbi:unnamed protein product [Durusdinium trenchii]|uniref:Uncharacterized protein n=1 Tax=Durusdinium trenchii TaxID=1381693 RepID=A0ABP0S327_9DINO